MLKKFILAGICALSAAAIITGCGSDAKPASSAASAAPEKKEIVVGATAGPHAEVVEAAAKEAEKNGLKVNVKEFSDYVTPDQALADGDLDLAVYQHEPFLQNFNKQHNTNLVSIGKAILMRMGIYSNKYKDVKDIPDGATISIPNDPTNEGLLLPAYFLFAFLARLLPMYWMSWTTTMRTRMVATMTSAWKRW